MKTKAESSSQWIYYLTAGSLFGAVVLRTLLVFWSDPGLGLGLVLLALWMVLFASEAWFSHHYASKLARVYFTIYLVIQIGLTLVLLTLSQQDFLAALFAILSMQVIQHFSLWQAGIWISLFGLLIALPLLKTYESGEAVALALVYTALNIFVAAYSLATRRAQAARAHNQALVAELQETNRQLQASAHQLEQLAVARERNHLARELHDSVTQTIFSMTLITQSALLLLDRDSSRVGEQLDRLHQLAQSALAETRVLISELRPQPVAKGRLADALRQHLASRQLPETLSISLEVAGDQPLEPAQEQILFRIAQEALNNVIKHSGASQAWVRLNLVEPCWLEVEDQGRGFEVPRVLTGLAGEGQGGNPIGRRLGLASMRERAAEIGWNLQVISSPGSGTRIRVEKPAAGG